MTLIIETKGLTKTFGSNGVAVHALRGIDFSVGPPVLSSSQTPATPSMPQ